MKNNIEKELFEIKKNISLSQHTTFKIGGKAKYFFRAKNKENLVKAMKLAKKYSLPFFVLGGGSNILVSDKKYEGLIIKAENSKCFMKKNLMYCESGLPLSQAVKKAAEAGFSGLEWAAGIPGTIGGAIRGNAGAFGNSMKKIVKEVETFDNKEIKIFKNKESSFSYRNSIFKSKPYLIILSAQLQLKKENKKNIKNKMKEILISRKEKCPLNFPSAGSIFKNYGKISAGKLIEECGLKGKRIGGAIISKKHANFILNDKKAKANDVMKLIKLIKEKVKRKFKIRLEEEICLFNIDNNFKNKIIK